MCKQEFKVAVVGGRDFTDYELLAKVLDVALSKKRLTNDIVIVSGMARGADTLGKKYATERGYKVVKCPAEWDTYGKRAGYMRNVGMAKISNAVVAFWDGKSKGTEHMINVSKYHLKTVIVKRY